MTGRPLPWLAWLAVLAAIAPAAPARAAPPATAPAAAHASAPAPAAPASAILLRAGNDRFEAGTGYRNATDWLALTCTAAGCSLEPASVTVRAETSEATIYDLATRGQRLHFALAHKAAGQTLAWLHADAPVAWLAPGPVTTWASAAAHPRRPAGEGTLELAVDLPGGAVARFVPFLDKANHAFPLQLRAAGKRQMLETLGGCQNMVDTEYLLWAGDLDHDGKPDFLVDFVDTGYGAVVLYLSSAAKPTEIVGEGARDAQEGSYECDGAGWLGDE